MKSTNNTTDFDDKLFFQVITESMKKVFVCPASSHYTIDQPEEVNKKDCIHQFIFKQDKIDAVHCMADGTIVQVTKDGNRSQVFIEHENGISTWFMADFVYGVPAVGVTMRQGEIIGHSKDFYVGVFVSPKSLFPGE